MESPACWGHAERVIAEVIHEHLSVTAELRAGWSLERKIADALECAGLLVREERKVHNHFTRDIRPDDCPVCAQYVTNHTTTESEP
jgi:hypothetical protein